MFSKIVVVSCVLAAVSAGLLPAAQYAPAAAVSSQSIIRHEQPLSYHSAPYAAQTVLSNNHGLLASPALALTRSAPLLHSAPALTLAHSTPLVHSAPAVTIARSAPLLHSAPALTLAHSAPLVHSAPAVTIARSAPLVHSAHQEIDTHPAYEFSYSVADGHTGDNKEQHEVRNGDAVQGSYSLLEADGSVRTVHYSADDHSGFNAVVSHSAPAAHPAPAPVAVAHAPILAHH